MSNWEAARKLFLLLVVVTLGLTPTCSGAESKASSTGPNIDELVFSVVPVLRPDVDIASLKARQIDMTANVQTLTAITNVSADPGFEVYKSSGGSTRMAFLAFNTRRNPFGDVQLRRAISCLVNRELIAKAAMQGWAEPLDTFVPQVFYEYVDRNASACGYDLAKARDILRDAGYTFDAGTKRMMDPETGKPLREMMMLTPLAWEAVGLWATGNVTSWLMNNVFGFTVRHVALPEEELRSKIINERDFDMMVYDHDFAPGPFWLYKLLHSSLDKPSTLAYSGIHDSDLDRALENLWFGVNKSEVLKAAHDAQWRLAALVPYVPVYSTCNVAAASPKWEGLVNMIGEGVVNSWTYIGVHKVGESFGGRFTQSISGELGSLNPGLANEHEWEVLNQLYTPLLTANPETLEDVPMLAEGWETEKWTTSTGKPGMRITFRLADGVMWHDGELFTAQDVKFCIEFLAANKIPQFQDIWGNLAKVETPDKAIVQIYLNETGYRYLYEFAGMTFLPEHIWKDVKDYKNFRPWEEPHQTVKGLTKLIGQGPFIFKEADLRKYVRLLWNPLYIMKNPEKPSLLERQPGALTALAGEVINVQYRVLNHTRDVLTDHETTFRLTVKKGDHVLLDLPAALTNGTYAAKIDTGKIGAGEYVCEFNAAPYGLDTFTLAVEESPVIMRSSWVFMSVGVVAAVAVTAVVILRKRGIRKSSLGSDAKV